MKSHSSRKHLLIVDDEQAILLILKNIFNKSDYRLSLCNNGENAKKIIEEQGCDLLLTDKNLPDLSGMELLKLAKQHNPFCEVIILTGYDSKQTMIEAIDNSAYAYLLKAEAMDNVFDIQTRVQRAFEKQDVILENQRLLVHLKDKNQELQEALIARKKLEEKLIQTEKMAVIGHFSAGISHELTAPLNGIRSLGKHLLQEIDRDLIENYANDIIYHADEIGSVVDELNSFVSKKSNDADSASLSKCIQASMAVFENTDLMQGVACVLDLDESVKIEAREDEVKQIFINLIKNALEAIREKSDPEHQGTLTLRCGMEEDFITATVQDNGVGIPEASLQRLFDPYYTTKNNNDFKGVGLGLNVSYRLVLKYYGQLSVHSTLQEGSSFVLKFPSLSPE